MLTKICYRKIKKSDFKYFEKIINKTWELNEFSKNLFINKLICKYDFYNYLSKSNFSVVASYNGRPIGLLLARNEKKFNFFSNLKYKLYKLLLKSVLIFNIGGRKYFKELKIMEFADKKLRKRYHRNYGAEFILFIVSKHYKGQVIGSKLIEHFIDYLKQNKINTYYLYTDEYCDVNYYFKHNYKKLGETEVTFDGDEEPSVFYIFSYNIKKSNL